MGSTNKTAHYELPQFVANDKPSWLGDINQAMEDIDTGIYGAKSSADGAQQTANNAVAGVASAGTRMDGIQTQLDTVATQANQTATTVTQHTSSIATNSANINTINSRLGSTDISGIGDGTVTGAIDAISQGGGGGGSVTTDTATVNLTNGWSIELAKVGRIVTANINSTSSTSIANADAVIGTIPAGYLPTGNRGMVLTDSSVPTTIRSRLTFRTNGEIATPVSIASGLVCFGTLSY